MEEANTERAARVVGREQELGELEALLEDPSRHTLVLVGEPGIGKTTLWDAGVEAARERGLRVLSARPSSAEARASFAALTDFFDGIDSEALATLPETQLRALEVALLRAEPARAPPEPHKIAVALLNALRVLAADAPLLVAVDDVQWLDPPSADALMFAARRLEDEEIGFLLATRPAGGTSSLERALERTRPERLEVAPLSLGATRRLLSERLGLTLPRHVLRGVFDACSGNPLFALELGRALVESGLPAIGEDIPVPDTVEDLLGVHVAQLSRPTRRLLLAVALSADPRVSELEAFSDPVAVEDAVEAGVLVVDRDRVRAAHPLLAAAARKRSRANERRQLHLALAKVVADEELRALHHALATQHPDAKLAEAVSAAAAKASARGSVRDAVALAEHALRLTPLGADERSDRVLELAGYLDVAGEPQRLSDLLVPELDSLPGGAARARAELLLFECAVTDDEAHQRLERALVESEGDAELRSDVLARMSIYATTVDAERIRDAEAWAMEALSLSGQAGPDAERLALTALAWARSLAGRSIDDVCERFHAVSDTAFHIAGSPERAAACRLIARGELNDARTSLADLLQLANERGEGWSSVVLRRHLCELELRAGEWKTASRLLDEWAESPDRDLMGSGTYERLRAHHAMGVGLPDDAKQWAASGVAEAEVTGARWHLLVAVRVRGAAALVAHEPALAAESLRAVWQHLVREGVEDPGAIPLAPDLVEALVELGELDEARAVVDRVSELAERQDHPWGLATAKRCDGLIRLAGQTYDEEAAEALAEAATDYEKLGLRFDAARSLLGLGRAQRRLRKWGAARQTLEQATAAFDKLGSHGWAEEARSELARVGARRPAPTGELTKTERRVVELAAEGHSNKEIAHALFVTVPTVEGHLSRAYAKLGVHSRGQLAARLADM